MKITILTLFPEVINSYIDSSIIAKAIKNEFINVEVVNFRGYSLDKHKKVDDYQYGGGSGMVLMLQPIVDAIKAIKTKESQIILLSAQGNKFDQKMANKISTGYKHIVLLCGHYEGFDERILNYVDQVISIGDYVLTGGELPALIITDAVTRLIDGVISKGSLLHETHSSKLLDFPVYTKPLIYDGHKVPEVLLSGNHKEIGNFKIKQQKIKSNLKSIIDYKKVNERGQ